ncbi:MAG: hypothetical protein ACXVX0_13035 [Blastococcus sp.]
MLSSIVVTTARVRGIPRRPPDDGRLRRKRARSLLLVPVLAAGLLVFTAGTAGATEREGGGFEHASHTLSITAKGHSYALSTTRVASGLVTTKLVNRGTQPHQAQLARFVPGKGVADFQAALKLPDPNAFLSVFDRFVGGPNVVAPGHSQTTIQNLDPGKYLILCFVPDAVTHMPHFLMGMYAPFSVVGPRRHGRVEASQAVFAVDEMRFVVPAELHSHSIVRFQNKAKTDVHEFTIGRLHRGKHAIDVQKWAAAQNGSPPFDDAGGAGALSPGGREWFTLHLRPGRYVAFCLVPDDHTGIPHAATGMVKEFTIEDD